MTWHFAGRLIDGFGSARQSPAMAAMHEQDCNSFGQTAAADRRLAALISHALAAALGLAIAVAAIAAPTAIHAQGFTRPGDFDFYVFALSIAPSFCDLGGYRRHKAECEDPSDSAYEETPLTIHGLWPNKRNRPVRDQPESCSAERLPRLSESLRRELERYMPGVADGLDGYEWMKHGVCSGMSPEAYFELLIVLAKKANATIGRTLRDRGFFGRQVAVRALIDAVAEENPELADALIVDCQFARQHRGEPSRAYVREIRILIDKEIRPGSGGWPASFVPRDSVGYGANSGCPRGMGFLPASFQQ
jgi:ribonuclease T2